MNALKLRNILLASIGLIIILMGVTIYYAYDFLHAETMKSVHTKIDAELGERDLEQLKAIQKTLKNNQESVQKAEQVVAATKQYQYQDQIINDINSYAAQTGVRVTAFDFGTPGAPAAAATQPAAVGVKSIPVTLTLQSPLAFDTYLRFIKAIEQNLTKMQVSGINLTPDAVNINNIVNPTIGVTVYVR